MLYLVWYPKKLRYKSGEGKETQKKKDESRIAGLASVGRPKKKKMRVENLNVCLILFMQVIPPCLYFLFKKIRPCLCFILIFVYLAQLRFDRDWKKIEAFVGSKTVIQVTTYCSQTYHVFADRK